MGASVLGKDDFNITSQIRGNRREDPANDENPDIDNFEDYEKEMKDNEIGGFFDLLYYTKHKDQIKDNNERISTKFTKKVKRA